MFGLSKITLTIIAVLIAALGIVGFMYRHDLIAYGAAVWAAKANARAVERMQEEAKFARQASEGYQRKLAELEGKEREKITEIVRIRDDTVCAGPALRHVLDGLRHNPGAGGRAPPTGTGRPGGAVPAPAKPAR